MYKAMVVGWLAGWLGGRPAVRNPNPPWLAQLHSQAGYLGGVNKSSYVHEDRFRRRQVLVSGGDAKQKRAEQQI